jgi:hypothetical protein
MVVLQYKWRVDLLIVPPQLLLTQQLRSGLFDPSSMLQLQVRQLLFAPSSYHMGLYPQLLQGDTKSPTDFDIPANKLQALILVHMYLVHGRCWENVKPFIEAGGLRWVYACPLPTHEHGRWQSRPHVLH